MFEWLFNLIYGAIVKLFGFINSTTGDIFSLTWVQSFILLFSYLGWMLFVCGLSVAIFDTAIAYESGQANIKSTCLNVLKGFMAASLVTVVPQRLYTFCTALQGTFAYDLLGNFIGSTSSTVAGSGLAVIAALASDVSLFSLFFMILFGYCTIKIVFANIKRGGIMLCQIAVGSLYMFSVVEWFVKHGIRVWSVQEGEQRFESHVDKLMNYIRFWQASGESEKTSMRIKTRMQQLTAEGSYKQRGFRNVRKDKRRSR